jgi:hypothetical protein
MYCSIENLKVMKNLRLLDYRGRDVNYEGVEEYWY